MPENAGNIKKFKPVLESFNIFYSSTYLPEMAKILFKNPNTIEIKNLNIILKYKIISNILILKKKKKN